MCDHRVTVPVGSRIVGHTLISLAQNNGQIAHQHVPHVHFHVIPKPAATDSEGLVVGWPAQKPSMDELKKLHEEILSKL